MYRFVENKTFLKKAQLACSNMLQDLIELLKEDGISSQIILVGSGGRNMITQNGDGDIDFDYNLYVQKCDYINDGRQLKECVRRRFNEIMKRYKLNDVQDSTSTLTTYKMCLKGYEDINFSIDLCVIAKKSDDNWYRLIHEKTGIVSRDRYFWNIVPDSFDVASKASLLKRSNLWQEVRNGYLNKKNFYLPRNDYNHTSFICYVEAVNEVFSKYFIY